MVVLLMVLYYIIFSGIDVSGLTVAVIGFTLTFGAGMYGMLCTGVNAVGRSPQEAYDRGMELLKRVGLAHAALKYPDQESGGQKQRIAIARALAMDPEVIPEITVDGPDYDFLDAYGQIAEYCGRNRIPQRTALRSQLVFEELVQQILLPELADPKIRFTVKYSEENERAGIVAAYKGPPIDLDAVKNELPMTLLKSAVSSMEQMIVPDDEPGNHICLEILS